MEPQKRLSSNAIDKLRNVTETLFYARNSNYDAREDIKRAISRDMYCHRHDSINTVEKLYTRRKTATDRIKSVKAATNGIKKKLFCF